MKTFKNYNGTLGVAALLLGAMAFTACSSDDIANQNPTFDGKSVKTQFAINIPHAAQQGTRMTDVNTQENNNFLGMYDIKLIPMTEPGAANKTFPSILPLEAIATKPTESGDNTWNDNNGFRKIYNDVNVPVGTKNFLFYGAGRDNTTATDKFEKGIITAKVAGSNTNDISFELEKAKTADNGECTKLITALNTVAGVSGWSTATSEPLKELYTNFTNLKAGSANSICATLQSLYDAVNKISDNTVATAIKNAIEGLNDGFSFDSSTGKLSKTLTYPQNMNMPDGAAVIEFKEGAFAAVANDIVIPTGSQNINMDNICYPASIYYFVNTDLAANDASEVTWPASLTNWSNGFTGWGAEVTASTRTIALKSPIQYGVAKLKTTVKCASTSLTDKKGTSVSVPAEGFPVTAVLVGGQPVKANWDFHPDGSSSDWTNVVYDKAGSDMKATTAESNANYTLVLDNKLSSETQEAVNIVIELTNNSTVDFYGYEDQIIPAGGTFYLVAKLDPKDKTVAGVTNPSVFMQDYTTTANLTINSLAKAYNVIPDLRASQMQLGLAVDLAWKQGITFEVTIGE